MKPVEFWALTPFETTEWCRQTVEEKYKHGVTIAWYVAMYNRQKKLPELSKVMRSFTAKSPVKPQSAKVLLEKVRVLNAAFGGKDLRHG